MTKRQLPTVCIFQCIIFHLAINTVNAQDILFEPGKPFKFMCSIGQAVAGIMWKWLPVAHQEAKEDFAVNIHCQQLVGIAGISAIFTDDSCYNAEFFSISQPIQFGGKQNCRHGDFVHGIAGVYEHGERKIRFICCKTVNLRLDPDFGCTKTHPQDVGKRQFGAFRNLKHQRSNCPKSALVGLSISRGMASAKFCPFTLKNHDYALYCHSDSNNGNVSRVLSARSNRQPKRLTVDTWPWLGAGEYTLPGKNFKLQCPVGEAVKEFSVQTVLVAETNKTDFAYKIECERISAYEQDAYRRRISKFGDVMIRAQCQNDEFLKGLWSEYRLGSRTLAYVCEEGSDIWAKGRPHTMHGRLTSKNPSRTFASKKSSQFIRGFRMSYGQRDTVHVAVEFDYFNFGVETKFYVSETLFEYDNAKFVAVSKGEHFQDWRRSGYYFQRRSRYY